jgi:hypothetical protein
MVPDQLAATVNEPKTRRSENCNSHCNCNSQDQGTAAGCILTVLESPKWKFRLNGFNRHYLSGPNTTLTSPYFGQVTGVSGNRTVQVGMRLDF